MKRLSQLFIVTAIWIILASAFGCANVSKATEEKNEAADTYVAPQGKGSVFLYRTRRAVGAARQLSVKVNGIDAGGTGPGTFFKLDHIKAERERVNRVSHLSSAFLLSHSHIYPTKL